VDRGDGTYGSDRYPRDGAPGGVGTYATYAYQVQVSDKVLQRVWGVSSAVSCLNDGAYLAVEHGDAPEPASLVLIGCAAGVGAVIRRRRNCKDR